MMLARAKPDDILAQLVLGDCSRRRIRGQSPDSSYSEAVRILEQGGQGLTALLKQNPALDWLREALLEDYCELVFCHSRVGRNAEAARIVNNDVQPLIAALSEQQADPTYGLNLLRSLCRASSLLQEGRQPTAALAITRQAAAQTFKFAANSLPSGSTPAPRASSLPRTGPKRAVISPNATEFDAQRNGSPPAFRL
jgi:hypothetical protein